MATRVPRSKWPDVIARLRLLDIGPSAYKVVALVRNMGTMYLGQDIWVNAWPDFTTVLITPGKKANVFLKGRYTFCTSSEQELRDMLCKLELVDWSSTVKLSAISREHRQLLADMEGQFGVVCTKEASFVVMETSLDQLAHTDLPEGYTWGELREADAEQVNELWKHGEGSRTLPYVELSIRYFDSLAVRSVSGDLAAFAMVQIIGSIGTVCVAGSHQDSNLAPALLCRLARKLLEDGQPAYSYLTPHDEAGLKLYLSCGFTKGDEALWLTYGPR